jgi:adenine-specific DNA-methyltransferase
VRLIGNKTKLLDDIEGLLALNGVGGGTLIDIFSGTAVVARHFKARGYTVLANDHLSACYAQAVAALEVNAEPEFRGLEGRYGGLREAGEVDRNALGRVISFLNRGLEGKEGLIFRSFCPGGSGRRYFTDENGRRIDAVLDFLRSNLRAGVLESGEFYLLLAALIDAADRVANISGTYGAFLKSWQSNALKRLEIVEPTVVESSLKHRAFQCDANEAVRKLRGDVLYVDPPYNRRQYAANYHVLDIIAEHHRVEDLGRFEAQLYGKTGLKPYAELKSLFCVPPGRGRGGRGDVWTAMLDLILSSRVEHVVVSYNEEGLLQRDEIGAILARFEGVRSYDFDRKFRELTYRRFRSDRDRDGDGAGGLRQYRVLEGRSRDEIREWLFFASRARLRAGRKGRTRLAKAGGG